MQAGGGIGNLNDLLLFYTLERKLFSRLVGREIGENPQNVKEAIAFWLLLEEIGFRNFTGIVQSKDDTTVSSIYDDTLKCLSLFQPQGSCYVDTDTFVFEAILQEPINLRFFYHNSELMFKKFFHIIETVCDRIFGETKEERTTSSGLDAREFSPKPKPVTECYRTLFLTFSKGYPLTPQEIINFFASEWGDVVEEVVVEDTRGRYQPVYGRIIFKEASMIPRVLNGQSKAKFLVGRKHLWARQYIQRRVKVNKKTLSTATQDTRIEFDS